MHSDYEKWKLFWKNKICKILFGVEFSTNKKKVKKNMIKNLYNIHIMI